LRSNGNGNQSDCFYNLSTTEVMVVVMVAEEFGCQEFLGFSYWIHGLSLSGYISLIYDDGLGFLNFIKKIHQQFM
jgi:hypothetical protein